MNKAAEKTERVTWHSKKAVHEALPLLDKLARMGYAAKGTVYLMVGLLAVLAAFGSGGRITDSKGAFAEIAAGPFGGVLLFVLAVGLACFFLWRLVQAFADPDGFGNGTKGILVRAGHFGGGFIYAFLAYQAIRILMFSSSGSSSERDVSAVVLHHPLGAVLIGIAGASLMGNGVYQLKRAFKASFTMLLRKDRMSPAAYRTVVRLARFGLFLRGLVFGLIGYFLIRTAFHNDPQETKGIDGALAELAKQPYGRWLLSAAALGLAAYGAYMFALARYRKTFDEGRV